MESLIRIRLLLRGRTRLWWCRWHGRLSLRGNWCLLRRDGLRRLACLDRWRFRRRLSQGVGKAFIPWSRDKLVLPRIFCRRRRSLAFGLGLSAQLAKSFKRLLDLVLRVALVDRPASRRQLVPGDRRSTRLSHRLPSTRWCRRRLGRRCASVWCRWHSQAPCLVRSAHCLPPG